MTPRERTREFYNAGRTARDAGLPLSDNPHLRGGDERPAWARGWRQRDAETPSLAEQVEALGDYACGYVDNGLATAWVGPSDHDHEEVRMDATTELQMVHAAREIGGIAEMASWATLEFVGLVALTGKSFEDLTIGEALHLLREYKNTVHV